MPNQDPGICEQFGLTRDDLDRAVWAIDHQGRRWSGAAAANRALRELGGAWPAVAALYSLPGVRDAEEAIYRWVARNRHSLSDLWGIIPPYSDRAGCCR